MFVSPAPGLTLDTSPVSSSPRWLIGVNVRFRLDQPETLGLFGRAKDVNGDQIILPSGPAPYRSVFVTPDTSTGQILFGSAAAVQLVDYDPLSTPATGTRWRQTPLTPPGMAAAADVLPTPSAARVEVPPVWWFSDQDDLIVGQRANVLGEPCYAWDRDRSNTFAPLAGSPTGAVGGGIISRILVLLGATSFTDPDPSRFMTVRWSDRFNFEDWTPNDINVSGELQLEGGSRIVGGGISSYGVVVWTDKRMALLTETFDPDSVFARRYVDDRGLLANRAWTEANGQVWFYDEHRVLNVFDGGRPRQIINPLKAATMERLSDAQTARAYLVPNPEYGEIILHYPAANANNPDRQLVYNYIMGVWYLWSLSRTGWHGKVGVIRNTAVDPDGRVWFHDLDNTLPEQYVIGPGNPNPASSDIIRDTLENPVAPLASDVEPIDFGLITSLITMEDVTSVSWDLTRVHAEHLPAPATGAETDGFDVVVTGYGEAQTESDIQQDWQTYVQGQNARDFRVSGKALQIGLYGTQVKTVFRFGGFTVTPGQGGAR